ncbi:MAG: hypothetical protein PHH61_01040 [Candidatus Nanoarchaeia archaeon]|nr:hypothetical protein [Candidatus Nanoarchaeia archaeon]
MIVKKYEFLEPDGILNELKSLLEDEADIGHGGWFGDADVYHLGDSTLVMEYELNEHQPGAKFSYLRCYLASSNEEINKKDFDLLVGYIRRIKPDCDLTKVLNETKPA